MCKIMNVFGQNGRENLWMFFQAVIAVYLLILSVIDIRWKKVSVRSLLILLVIAVLCQVLCSKGELRMMVAGGLCRGGISEAQAKQIVEQRAGTTGTYREFKLERDDGRTVYEGELRSGQTEYDFTIDATTGTILEWEVDR